MTRSRTRVHMFDEKTGHPWVDTESRKANKRFTKATKNSIRVCCAGWKRKRRLTFETRKQYVQLLASLMEEMRRNKEGM